MALLHVLVCALKDGVLLQGGYGLLLVNTAQPGGRVGHTVAEVNSA